MDKKKILAHAGKVYYGVFSEAFETTILEFVIDHPKITAEELAFIPFTLRKDRRVRDKGKIRNEYVAQKFIDLARGCKR